MPTLPGADQTLRSLLDEVEHIIARLGVMYRIFGRAKSEASIDKKMVKKGYAHGGKLLQDLVGIRVVVYFAEDCGIVQRAVSEHFIVEDEAVDIPGTDEFGPRRLNLVLRANGSSWDIQTGERPIDSTFELQIRTVLSEGWHEVEHDLRYKCSDDWTLVPDKLRTLNGTLAAIETAEWAMASLFEGLAYHHYKEKCWEAMLRHKFRLRLQDGYHLSDGISGLLDEEPVLAKRLWRADRAKLIDAVARSGIELPWTFDNLVHLVCAVEGIDHSALAGLRTNYVAKRIDEAFSNGARP